MWLRSEHEWQATLLRERNEHVARAEEQRDSVAAERDNAVLALKQLERDVVAMRVHALSLVCSHAAVSMADGWWYGIKCISV